MNTVQLVSKPVAPPWNDATTVLVHGLLTRGSRFKYRFFGTPESHVLERGDVRCDVVSRAHRFQPTLGDNLRTLARVLVAGREVGLYHCLFTPNPRTSSALRIALGVKRRPVVHTLCSSPVDWAAVVPLLFADRIVTVSEWARLNLERHGVERAVHIPPGINQPQPDPAAEAALRQQYELPADRPCLLFAGDFEFSDAHPTILEALPEIVRLNPRVVLVFACRTKTPEAAEVENQVRQRVEAMGLVSHVRFLREVPHFESLVSLATVMLFPVRSLRKKMDIPLTLLQALALGRPIVPSTLGPLTELMDRPVGLAVPPGDASALAEAVTRLLADASVRQAMGLEGRRLVEERYTVQRMADNYERLYGSLLGSETS